MNEFLQIAFLVSLALAISVVSAGVPECPVPMYTDLSECDQKHPESLCVIRYVPIEVGTYE